jgi:DNA (cytosine-5)-methyltransferase 1
MDNTSGSGLPKQFGRRIEPEGFTETGIFDGMGHAKGIGHERTWKLSEQAGRHGIAYPINAIGLANTELQQRPHGQPGVRDVNAAPGWQQGAAAATGLCDDLRPGPTNGYWRDADWLGCTDGKFRAVESGTFPLVDGPSGRVGRVRADQEYIATIPRKDQGSRIGRLNGYGNAINAMQAQIWIETVMGIIEA